jgi:hypothetical protein
MSNLNPLQQYFRQPKIYISLPSKGLYYTAGSFQGDYNNVPIMSMTGMDEILMKTPDALFSGEAAFKVIESCCPFVKNAKQIPSTDVDTLLTAIRIATYGNILNLSKDCVQCGSENDYELDLQHTIAYFQKLRFINEIKIDDNLTINIRPLTYEQMNYFGLENFKLQKTATGAYNITDEEEKIRVTDQVFADLSELQLAIYLASIEQVKVNNQIVTDQQHIYDWLKNMDRDVFTVIKSKLEANKKEWEIPEQPVKCGACEAHNVVQPVLDQANFFV